VLQQEGIPAEIAPDITMKEQWEQVRETMLEIILHQIIHKNTCHEPYWCPHLISANDIIPEQTQEHAKLCAKIDINVEHCVICGATFRDKDAYILSHILNAPCCLGEIDRRGMTKCSIRGCTAEFHTVTDIVSHMQVSHSIETPKILEYQQKISSFKKQIKYRAQWFNAVIQRGYRIKSNGTDRNTSQTEPIDITESSDMSETTDRNSPQSVLIEPTEPTEASDVTASNPIQPKSSMIEPIESIEQMAIYYI